MLHTIDILIGFTVVMLILSAIVTMLVQFTVSTLLNLKGAVLRSGIAQLLMLLDKDGLTAAETREIATRLLRDSLVGRKMPLLNRWRLAGTVHREELVKLILDFAGNADLTKADALMKGTLKPGPADDLLRERLLNSLRRNGLVDPPAEILRSVRTTMLALEQARPELAADVRQTIALLTHASSEFLAKMNAWFDQTIDRTIDAFTARARIWTTFFAAVVALFFQVNTFELIQRLSVDQEARQMLVSAAIEDPGRFEPLPPAQVQPAGGEPTTPAPAAGSGAIDPAEALRRIRNDPELGRLVESDLITWPRDLDAWSAYWTGADTGYGNLVRLIGILLTISLLGLGAPLWYELLKNLIQLRSVVARKDDAQRLLRQTSQEPVAAAPPTAPVPVPPAPRRRSSRRGTTLPLER